MNNHNLFFSLYKINKYAKDCKSLKQSAYKQRKHNLVQYYKKQQKYLNLLKTLTLLDLKDKELIKLEDKKYIQKDTNTILLGFICADGSSFNFHSIFADQEMDENEEYFTYYPRENDDVEPDATPLLGVEVYKRFLIKNLSEKYKKILDIFNEEMEIDPCTDMLQELLTTNTTAKVEYTKIIVSK